MAVLRDGWNLPEGLPESMPAQLRVLQHVPDLDPKKLQVTPATLACPSQDRGT